MFGGISRLLYLAGKGWQSIFVLGLLVAVIGGGVAVTAEVPTETQEKPGTAETVQISQTHSAVVTGQSTVYERGTELRDEKLYVLDAAPNATVTQNVTGASSSGEITVETKLVYEVQIGSETLYSEQHSSVRQRVSGESATVSLPVNMSTVASRAGEIQKEFGTDANVNVVIKTAVVTEGSGKRTISTKVRFTDTGYKIPTETTEITVVEPESVEQPVQSKTVQAGGMTVSHKQLAGAGGAGVGIIMAVVALVYFRRFTQADLDRLYKSVMCNRYRELIAHVSVGEPPTVDTWMESLGDLVYVAEDSVRPMMRYPDAGLFVVETDERVFGFQFDSDPVVEDVEQDGDEDEDSADDEADG